MMRDLVMPLLEAFKPDIVINSAGQDNHFSDPITNMNFSAGGYAQLTAMLRPDIAVLEGGYAVESALPYVNVGIIMAMAGLDTSNIKEPTYDRDYKPQSPDTTRYIERIVGELRKMFLQGGIKKTEYRQGDIIERRRDIFYDTDMISDRQRENIRVCRECAGALSIDSSSSRGRRIFAVHIPRKACRSCRQVGEAWFDSASRSGSFDHLYLQDRYRGRYEVI